MMRSIALAAALALGGAGAAEAAQVLVQTFGSPGNAGGSASSATGPVSTSGSNSSAFGSTARFSAFTDYGIHKVSADISSAAFTDTSSARSQWTDAIQITSSRAGYLTFGIDIEAVLASDPATVRGPTSARGTFQYQMTAVSGIASSSYARSFSNVLPSSGGFSYVGPHIDSFEMDRGASNRFVGLSIAFGAGTSFINLNSIANCHAQAIGDGNAVPDIATASCDAGNSVYWGGVLSVVDVNGNAITDYTLASESGTDYAQSFVPSGAVPEPGTWTTIILGFGAAGAVIRRRRSALA